MEASEKLGKYQVQAILGEGGMGVVYKAYDPHLARVVAIKTIRASLLEGKSGQELRERFRREARAEGRLVHPNIITIYEYQEDAEGTPFFVMEFVEGKDLKQYLSRGIRFNLDKTLYLIEQVLSALAHSHREGIVHRDIKPANIILLENDTVKIADFGIAKMEESEYTQTGMVMGTPQYISPEQRLGRHVDGRTDLYSVGAVMFELLTGQKASAGMSETGLWSRLKEGNGNKLDTSDAKTQRIFNNVVLKALASDPDDRFASADAFLEAIQDARPTPESRPKPRYLGVLVGAVLGAALLAGVYLFTQPQDSGNGFTLPGQAPKPAARAPVSKPVQLSTEQSAKLDRHLKVARTHLKIGRLLLPAGSNAYHSYQLALQIDPGNQEAQEGMEAIKQGLLQRIDQAIIAGDFQQARQQLQLGLEKFPGDASLEAVQQAMN